MSGVNKRVVYLYTDGACSPNPGPGGWGALIKCEEVQVALSGGEPQTTNNRMELLAAINGLEAIVKPSHIVLTSDSRYLVNGITKNWAKSWKRNGWVKSDGKPALNPDLWDRLLAQLEKHEVEFVWVKGHAGHPENEYCDKLATGYAQNYK